MVETTKCEGNVHSNILLCNFNTVASGMQISIILNCFDEKAVYSSEKFIKQFKLLFWTNQYHKIFIEFLNN